MSSHPARGIDAAIATCVGLALRLATVAWAGGGAMPETWFVPPVPADMSELPANDAFGNEVPATSSAARYCVNLRLGWIQPPTTSTQGLARAEVRVWWYKEGVSRVASYANCGAGAGAVALSNDIETLHFVYSATAITGNPL